MPIQRPGCLGTISKHSTRSDLDVDPNTSSRNLPCHAILPEGHEAPETYGFDRGGYSEGNIKKAQKLGVKNVGIAPKGQSGWAVSERLSEAIRRERAQVEGVIGNVKSKKYGFNKPNVKSTVAMEASGHRSLLGFNMVKALRLLHPEEMQTA